MHGIPQGHRGWLVVVSVLLVGVILGLPRPLSILADVEPWKPSAVENTPTIAPTPKMVWRTRLSGMTPRSDAGMTVASGKVFVIGGNGSSPGIGKLVEVYDPLSNEWIGVSYMPTGRDQLGVAAAGGRIYAIGGADTTTGNTLATVEEYDPAMDTWTLRSPMPTARRRLDVVAGANGKIYAIGGASGSNLNGLAAVEQYDPATDTWTSKASMPTARWGLGLAAANTGKIYGIGGYFQSSGGETFSVGTVEEYDPAMDTWATKTAMPSSRGWLGAITAPNGKVYAIGGKPASGSLFSGSPVAVVEEYDPLSDTWTISASLHRALWHVRGAATASGTVYVVGDDVVIGGRSFNEMTIPLTPTPLPTSTSTATPTSTSTPAATTTPTVTPTATPTIAVQLQAGWNNIALPEALGGTYTARGMLDEMTGQGLDASQIARWENGSWESYLRAHEITPFQIEPRRGYFVKMGNYGVWRPRPTTP